MYKGFKNIQASDKHKTICSHLSHPDGGILPLDWAQAYTGDHRLERLSTRGVVILTSKILEILGIQGTYQGSIIRLPSIALDVRFGCNGLEAVMIYAVAVIAFPTPWKNRLTGIVGGFVAIQVINILRIASLAYSAIHFKSLFEYIPSMSHRD